MACKKCGADIHWAWNETVRRWLPIEPCPPHPHDRLHEGSRILDKRRHRVHECLPRETIAACATLFVSPSAPKEVIAAAFRALALMLHPDVGGTTREMQDLVAARDWLLEEE